MGCCLKGHYQFFLSNKNQVISLHFQMKLPGLSIFALLGEAVNYFLGAGEGFAADVVVGPEALFAAIDEAGVTQDAQVMRNSGLFEREAFDDFKDAYLAFVTAEQA